VDTATHAEARAAALVERRPTAGHGAARRERQGLEHFPRAVPEHSTSNHKPVDGIKIWGASRMQPNQNLNKWEVEQGVAYVDWL
jgi:hypothetical protein